MHLAAKGNAIQIAKLLSHIRIAEQKNDAYITSVLTAKEKIEEEKEEKVENDSKSIYFELNRTNLSS